MDYQEQGYVVGAIVRQYHHADMFNDAKILHVHTNGALDVEMNGERYGWSIHTCTPLSKIAPT